MPVRTGGSVAIGRRTTLTGRAAVFALAVCAVVLTLAYPLRAYLAQHAEIARLEAQQRASQARLVALKSRAVQLQDPEYLRSQARTRLHYVTPGERLYILTGRPVRAAAATPAAAAAARSGPWYAKLWSSAQVAGRPSR